MNVIAAVTRVKKCFIRMINGFGFDGRNIRYKKKFEGFEPFFLQHVPVVVDVLHSRDRKVF